MSAPVDVTETREEFWQAVDLAATVLAAPQLVAQWDRASALQDMTVGDLTAHLVRAVTTVVHYLGLPAPSGDPLSPAAYYAAVLGDPGDLQSAQNRAVRQRAHEEATPGHGQTLRRWEQAVAQARDRLTQAPPDRLVTVAGDLVLTVDDYLATRVVELVVHVDDLAVSLGIDPPPPPPAAARLAEHVLLDIARHRHGDTALLRALARRERTSTVLPVL
jgi:uncharacterized protein (TIGR03083 family)